MNIKETKELLETIPPEQAIMLKGIHGVGKSEFITDYFKGLGYEVHVFFGATAADAGDIIGLPRHETIIVNGEEFVQTSFSPPQWWPKDPTKPVVIFLDEANRAKADIQNCFMDMILNRKLNGRILPENTRVIAGINPFEDGFYEVNKTDPAFNDRFIIIDFHPSLEEWVDWMYSKDAHQEPIDFVIKHSQYLDPSKESDEMVQPSRRSWKRVSDYLKRNPSISDGTFYNYLLTCVGSSAKSHYQAFRTNKKRNLSALNMLKEFTKELEIEIRKMPPQEICFFNLELFYWFERNIEVWAEPSKESVVIFNNLYRYLRMISDELAVQFLEKIVDQFQAKNVKMIGKQTWAEVFQHKHKDFEEILSRTIRGI